MTNPRVLCLGEVLFDCLADQEAQSLAEVKSWTNFPGGAPANVACALVKLGTSAGFIGCVGEDQAAQDLATFLDNQGVNLTGIQRHPSAPTRQVYVLRSINGDRTFAGFGNNAPDIFADAFLEANKLPHELFLNAEFLVIGTLGLAYPHSREAIFKALELAQQYHVKVVVDVNWREQFWQDTEQAIPLINKLWQYVDFIKLSKEEAQWLFNTSDAGSIFYRLNNLEGVIVTDGEHKVSYCLSGNEGVITPFEVDVKDTTGAGDAFVAGLIHQLCQQGIASLKNQEIVRQIVVYASAVGSLTTTKLGAIASQPSAAEVDTFLTN